MSKSTLTFVLNDPPYESARSTTALRLIDLAVKRGINVNVFAYEGAAALAFAKQKPHGNPIHGRDAEAEDHPTTQEWIASILSEAKTRNVSVDWVNCGLCVDERGVQEAVAGTRRGGPPDLAKFMDASTNTIVVPTRG